MTSVTRRGTVLGLAAYSLSISHLVAGPWQAPSQRTGPGKPRLLSPGLRAVLPPTPELPNPPKSGIARVNGTEIYYAQFGIGADVVCLHGGLASSDYWGHQVTALAAHFRVTVMDTRGHCRSPLVSSEFGYQVFAADVLGLLDFLEIKAASVVGWSDGAITGLYLASRSPARISSLFAFAANRNPAGVKPGASHSPIFVQFLERARREYQSRAPNPSDWTRLVSGMQSVWRTQPNLSLHLLSSIKIPTAIVDGEFDEIIKADEPIRMSQQIPDATLLIQPNVGHFAMLQDPGRFTSSLLQFLLTSS
jgi:pimeloyl-ACP methyl ester carboxylesterase